MVFDMRDLQRIIFEIEGNTEGGKFKSGPDVWDWEIRLEDGKYYFCPTLSDGSTPEIEIIHYES